MRTDRIQTLLFAVFLALPVGGLLLGMDPAVTAENRSPAPAPRVELLATGEFPAAFDAWFDDHYGFRRWLIRADQGIQYAYDPKHAGIAIGRDGWLFMGRSAELADSHCVRARDAEAWRALGRERQRFFAKRGVRFLWVMAPNKHTLYPEFFPEEVGDLTPGCSHTDPEPFALDLRPGLAARASEHRVYHRTDSHWNQLGAFFAAGAVADALRPDFRTLPRLELDDLIVTRRVDEYGGNLSHKLSVFGLRFEEERVALSPPGGWRGRPVEGTPPLDPGRDSHRRRRLIVETGRPELPVAVVYHDSFGYAMMPALAEHFRRTVFLHTNGSLDLETALAEEPDLVIALFVEDKLRFPPPTDREVALSGDERPSWDPPTLPGPRRERSEDPAGRIARTGSRALP